MMKTNPLKEGALTKDSAGIGTITRRMLRERAIELAAINGRSAQEVSKSDWKQARLQLTGDSDPGSNDATLESATESERWDPVHGSTGHKVQVAPSEDEDAEGSSDSERLMEQGISEAELDQTKAALRRRL